MEALRKAEEAKRRAQNNTTDNESESPLAMPVLPVTDAREELAQSEKAEASETVQSPQPVEPVFGLRSEETPVARHTEPLTSESPKAEAPVLADHAPQPSVSDTDSLFAGLKLAAIDEPVSERSLPAFMTAESIQSDEIPGQAQLSETLKIAEPQPMPEQSAIPELALDTNAAQQADLTAVPEPTIVSAASVSAAPVLESPELLPLKSVAEPVTEEKPQRVATPISAQAERAAARAMFAAKQGNQKVRPGKRTIVLGAVALTVVIVLAGGMLLLPSMLGGGNQYNIPPNAPAFGEFPGQAGQESVPIDDSAELAVVTETPDTAVTEALAANQPEISEPAVSQAAVLEPVVSELSASEPAASGPVASEPAALAEATPESVTAEPDQSALTTTTPVSVASEPDPVASSAPTTEPAVAPVATEQTPVVSAAPAIQIRRSPNFSNPDMQLLSAWSAYQQGDFAAARILYQQYLALNPDNRDALLGLAGSALQLGDAVSARAIYGRLLSLNPKDPLARTGLLETTRGADPIQRESELKALQREYPDMPAIGLSLGGLFASQQRWHEAQQAYYDALLLARTQAEGPVNPDYAFNLAISLEHLNQPAAALNFYREARMLATRATPSFDVLVLEQRIEALAGSLP